jgi:hypothetical protein
VAVSLGFVAIVSVVASGVLVMFDLIEPMSTTQIVLALPIFLQEMVLAVWLIGKGFDPSAIASTPAGATPRWRTTTNPASGRAA